MSRAIRPNGQVLRDQRKQYISNRKKHKRIKPRGEMIRRRISRKKIVTEQVISPRFQANLLEPGKPFAGRPRESLLSTCFAKVQYDPWTSSLKVWFWAYKQQGIGGIYILWDIAQWEYEEFLNSSSKGRYFYYTWRWPNGSRRKAYTRVKK